MPISRKPIPVTIDPFSDFALTLRWLLGPTQQSLAPKDLTDWTALWEIRQQPQDASPIVSISTTPNVQGQVTLGGAAGTIGLAVGRATTAELLAYPLSLGHTLILIDPNGARTTFAFGHVSVTPGNAHP